MRQVLIQRGKVSVGEVPAPMLQSGQVLVEVSFSLISSGTELAEVNQSGKTLIQQGLERPDLVRKVLEHLRRKGIKKTVAVVRNHIEAPETSGYSCSGVVLQVGAGIVDILPGDRVGCAGVGYANHAELVVVPRNLLAKVPREVGLREAASATMGAIAMQGVRRADARLGESVAVIGLGILGLLTVQLLKASGCRVIATDLDERRVRLAEQLGADQVVVGSQERIEELAQHFTGGYGVDVTIITASSEDDRVVQQAMEITRKKGRVVIVGAVGLGLQRSPFYEKEIDFLISSSYGPGRYDPKYEEFGIDYPLAYVRWTENRNMYEYLRLLADGKVKLESLYEREYELTEAPKGYEELRVASSKPLGVLLRYPTSDKTREIVPTQLFRRSEFRRLVTGKIRLALVGSGNFAKTVHLPNLRKLSHLYHLRAVVSATGINADSTARQFGAEYASTSYDEIVSDPGVDAVLIATRHHLHTRQVVAALQAHKHVYCEKPLVLNHKELDEVLGCYGTNFEKLVAHNGNKPDANNPVLMVGFNRRFTPAAARLRDLISRRNNPLIAVYRVQAERVPHDSWVNGPEGGGRLLGEGCHMLDLFQFLIGAPATQLSVQQISPRNGAVSTNDNAVVTLQYEDGSVCTLVYTSLGDSQSGKEYLEVFVDGKTLILDDFRTLRRMAPAKIEWSSKTQDKGHQTALLRFADAVQGKEPWPISLEEQASVSALAILSQEVTEWSPSSVIR